VRSQRSAIRHILTAAASIFLLTPCLAIAEPSPNQGASLRPPEAMVSRAERRRLAGIPRDGGRQCTPYGEKLPRGPINYSINDVGKPRVPRLDAQQKETLRRIRHFVRSPALRFVFLTGPSSAAFKGATMTLLLVYDAKGGACWGGPVLNGQCSELYEPDVDPGAMHGEPGGMCFEHPWGTARPFGE